MDLLPRWHRSQDMPLIHRLLLPSVILLAVLPSLLLPQDLPRPEFEVASIRPSTAPAGGTGRAGVQIDGSQVRCVFFSLRDYISMAYQMRIYQITGPDWLPSERFDVAAKIPAESPRDKIPAMLQALLAERFQMKAHRDKKEFSVYALVQGRNPLKLKETAEEDPAGAQEPIQVVGGGSANGVGVDFGKGSSVSFGNNKLEGKKITMASFVETLWRFMDRPVVDETGLKGRYDFSMEVTPEDYQAMLIHAAVNAGVVLPPQALRVLDTPNGDSLVRGLDVLGLKLESKKAMLDVLVVDRVSRTPTEN